MPLLYPILIFGSTSNNFMDNQTEKQFELALSSLKKHWGYDQFRPGQDDVVKSVFSGNDTLVLFPTGGGKSLCYQVPALVLKGLTIVISPLVALMEDQVDQLQKRNISATFINSNITGNEIEQRLVNARNGMYKLLYCAPERLNTELFKNEMLNLNIALVAIDEAHCISEWGHDFRPQYRLIRDALQPIEDKVRWLALTATATPEVRDDILSVLRFKNPTVISKGFARPNLKWWVYSGPARMKAIERMVQKQKGSGLIYAGTRKLCDELALKIGGTSGIKTAAYHAGLDAATRTKVQEAWIRGDIPLVTATNAFGMGIDKSDCRYVIHHDPPGSLEAYYQEAGRAGRDGALSYPLLCYKPSDVQKLKTQIEQSYPDYDQLLTIYTGLCDSLGLAIGSGMEKNEAVDIESVQKRTGLSRPLILGGIKVLDKLKIFELATEYSNDIGIQFLFNFETIRTIKTMPGISEKKADFIETIFRVYGPESLQNMVYINLKYLTERTEFSPNRILSGLEILKKEQFLTYRQADGNPLVRIVTAREAKPTIERKGVEKYRNILLKKLEHIKGYAETADCRSRYLRMYFGEQNPSACGMCDNCLNSIKKLVIPETLTLTKIKEVLVKSKASLEHIHQVTELNGLALFKAIEWMKREGLIREIKHEEHVYYELA